MKMKNIYLICENHNFKILFDLKINKQSLFKIKNKIKFLCENYSKVKNIK